MADILIVEDNIELARLRKTFICKAGYTCECLTMGEDALRYLKQNEVGIVVLDIMLPGMDGFEVCSAIHKSSNTPVIVLSARVEKDDKLNTLLLGADDYIEKPYDMDLLLAKISALFRRHCTSQETVFTLNNLCVNAQARTVHLNGESVALGTDLSYPMKSFNKLSVASIGIVGLMLVAVNLLCYHFFTREESHCHLVEIFSGVAQGYRNGIAQLKVVALSIVIR